MLTYRPGRTETSWNFVACCCRIKHYLGFSGSYRMDFDSKVGWGSGRPGRREAIEQAGEGD